MDIGRSSQHEELLINRGWKALDWSAGATQRVSIVRWVDQDGPTRLTRAEFELVRAVALGQGPKQAAAERGVEWATARTRLSRALHKLGLRSSAQLPGFWHGLAGKASSLRSNDGTERLIFEARCFAPAVAAALTSAEHDLLLAVLAGLDSKEIARRRNTSVRTVANQLATLFRKYRASTKGELASLALQLSSDS
jgi:DNA-binding CsgD family transcriptional regulator